MDWVCSEGWRPAFTQSMFYVGSIFGSLVLGWAADARGRVFAVVASNALVAAAGTATSLADDFYTFTALRFVLGAAHISYFAVFLLLGKRQKSNSKFQKAGA